MIEHLILVVSLIGWLTTYIVLQSLKEEYDCYKRRERNLEMRDLDEIYRSRDPVVNELRTEVESLRSQLAASRAVEANARERWKTAKINPPRITIADFKERYGLNGD